MTKQQNKNLVMAKLNDFIKTYDTVATPEECQIIISGFERYKMYHSSVDNQRRPKFTEMNYTANIDKMEGMFGDIHARLINAFRMIKKDYFEHVVSKAYDGTPLVPAAHGWEQFRIKRYKDKNDQFKEHVDIGDSVSAKRYLAFLMYLNDGFDGGETEFTTCGLTVVPKAGRVVVFPPTWNFPHQGNKLKNGKKYILSTYLNYI